MSCARVKIVVKKILNSKKKLNLLYLKGFIKTLKMLKNCEKKIWKMLKKSEKIRKIRKKLKKKKSEIFFEK